MIILKWMQPNVSTSHFLRSFIHFIFQYKIKNNENQILSLSKHFLTESYVSLIESFDGEQEEKNKWMQWYI